MVQDLYMLDWTPQILNMQREEKFAILYQQ